MRLFVGIPLPEEIREAVDKYLGAWRERFPAVRYVSPENLHITLKFLGDVPDTRIDDLDKALKSVRMEPFSVEAWGLGAFPHILRPRVLWIGVKDGRVPLTRLAREVENTLESIGFAPEARQYHPHITIGRLKRPDPRISTLLQQDAEKYFGRFTVDGFILYSSTLTPDGPIYSALREYRW